MKRFGLVMVVVVLSACGSSSPAVRPIPTTTISAPSAPKAASSPSTGGRDATHPDPTLTPGAIFATATEATVCVAGYTTTVRHVSSSVRAQVFTEYGIRHPTPGAYEVDHLVPLELGGTNDITNLWPEPYRGANNAHNKDAIENRLHRAVCAGAVTLPAAQHEIVNWDGVARSVPSTTVP